MSTIERILDFAEKPAYVRADGGLLVVESEGAGEVRVPLKEVAAVILAHPQTTITRGALAGLAEAGAMVVVADERYVPVAMHWPLGAFHAPVRRMAAQLEAGAPLRKRLWQQIVRAKIGAQAELLREERGEDFGLENLAEEVRSGDPENCEGQAARVYWTHLFGDQEFLRRTDAPNQNRYLNYAYAVVRAVTARAVCAVGLHPGLGIHHHHRADAFCLADDLMEPFRPAADRVAVGVWRNWGPDAAMEPKVKAELVEVMRERFTVGGEERELVDMAGRLASSVAGAFEGLGEKLVLPEQEGP